MPYTMTEENPSTFFGKLLNIMYEHGKEVYGENVNVNLNAISNLINLELVKLFVLWHNDMPVGYSTWITSNDFMFAEKTRADEIAVYVQKEHRGRPAVRFLKFTEMCLYDKNIKRIVRYAQIDNPLAKVFKKLGYGKDELLLIKDF